MRVFICSTSEDLKEYRAVVEQVVLDANWVPVGMEHFPNDPRSVIQRCRDEVDKCDLIILLQAFRRGWVPSPEEGGDGTASITGWEVKAADTHTPPIPVLAFLADDDWPRRLSDLEPEAVKWVDSFRVNLNRPVKFFGWETGELAQFRALVREQLAHHRERIAGAASVTAQTALQIRRICPEPSQLPDQPYPLLGPYEHPRIFAGRDAEIEKLVTLVHQRPLILCVHAASGAGKSSLMLAGLGPRLRTDGYLVSVERAPGDPGLAQRLIADVLTIDSTDVPADDDERLPAHFVSLVSQAHRLTGRPTVFVLDQFDDVLRSPQKRSHALAVIGTLLATTAQRVPGGQGFACKWVLCYRNEVHGEVRAWLEDVLVHARATGRFALGLLPSDLSDPQKSHDWALPVFGRSSSAHIAHSPAHRAFLDAIVRPLDAENGDGRHYQYVMSADDADRLASVFAEFRRDSPDAPLVPEFQVVLNHLLRTSRAQANGGPTPPIMIEVPQGDALRGYVQHALRDHVETALNGAFLSGRHTVTARQTKTRALLALQQLAGGSGRVDGISRPEFMQMIGFEGDSVLAKLTAADTRLIVVDDHDRCRLSHDCLAAAIIDVLESDAVRRSLVVDDALIDLQRRVGHKIELFAAGDTSSLATTRAQFRMIRSNRDLLITTPGAEAWWAAARASRTRSVTRLAIGAIVLMVASLALGIFVYRGYQENLRYDFGYELLDGVMDDTLRAPELLDLIDENYQMSLSSPSVFGMVSYATEEVWRRSSSPDVRQRAVETFRKVRLAFIDYQIRQRTTFQAPPSSAGEDPLNRWIPIAGGVFLMGDSAVLLSDEGDPHSVSVSPFSIQQHEVTNEEYRRFDPTYEFRPGAEREPAVMVSWYEAAGYAAWLGGSLPTEAQWEYAARGTGRSSGRRYPWGDAAPNETLAIYNTRSPAPVGTHPAGRTPEGVDDMAGSVWEWCRDAYGPYHSNDNLDPFGPIGSAMQYPVRRILRGGSYANVATSLRSGARGRANESERNGDVGFRVVSSHFHR